MNHRYLLLPCLLLALAACRQQAGPDDASAPANANEPATETAAAPEELHAPVEDLAPEPTPEPERAEVVAGLPAKIPLPPPTTATPEIALGAAVEYACENGSTLRVRYGDGAAELAWTGNRQVRLASAAADGGGGDLYQGEGFSLRRLGSTLHLQGGGVDWRCAEAASSA